MFHSILPYAGFFLFFLSVVILYEKTLLLQRAAMPFLFYQCLGLLFIFMTQATYLNSGVLFCPVSLLVLSWWLI